MALLLVGCGDDTVAIDGPDAGIDAAVDAPTDAPDFFGEACSEAPSPANTTCHASKGWCISGTCRPQCGMVDSPYGCVEGTRHYYDRGACYCAP